MKANARKENKLKEKERDEEESQKRRMESNQGVAHAGDLLAQCTLI